jgi:hypothetical protein
MEFFDKGVEKLEHSTDLNKRAQNKLFLKHMRYLLLDDSYLRQLLRLQRWTRVIEEREDGKSEDSEASVDDDQAFNRKLAQDQGKQSILHEVDDV